MYSSPVNDDRYAEKGVRSKREGDKAPAMPGPFKVDPDAMYLGPEEELDGKLKKRRSRSK